MKILMVPSGYYPECCGGVEVITQALSEGLVKKGHEVIVICQSDKNQEYILNEVKVYKIKPKELKNNKSKKIIYKINRILQMYNPFNKKKIKEILNKEKPDIVHLHMARKLSMSILKVCEEMNIPVISTLHEYFSLWNFNPFDSMERMLKTKPQWYIEKIRNKHRKLTKNVKYITAPLKKTIETYQKQGYYKNVKGTEIINALPMFNEEKRRKILETKIKKLENNDNINFLIISRLMPFKGIEIALESFMECKEDKFVLNVVGDGLLVDFVKKCSNKDSRIKYHGYLIGEEKDKIFKDSDILIFPTTELETFGLVILEAYNYSMPVITSSVEATKRLVNNKTGIVIDKLNKDNLRKAIQIYRNKKQIIIQMKNVFEKVKEINYDKFIENYEEIYKKVKEG